MLVSQVYHLTLGVIIALVAVLIVAKRFGRKGNTVVKSNGKKSRIRNRRR